MLAEMGDFTSALSAYSKAIELKPDFGEAYYNRGYAYFQLGNQRERGRKPLESRRTRRNPLLQSAQTHEMTQQYFNQTSHKHMLTP